MPPMLLPMLGRMALSSLPFLAKPLLKKVANPLIRRGLFGASVVGAGLANNDAEKEARIYDLMESGLSESQARQMVEQTKGTTLQRSILPTIGDALLANSPLGFLPGLGLSVLGGAVQGNISGRERGYDDEGRGMEILSGAGMALVPNALEGLGSAAVASTLRRKRK